jgi:hypothetical protein
VRKSLRPASADIAASAADRAPWTLLALLTVLILFVQGYHPWSNDAGIYLAGVRKLIDPGLYHADAPFIVSHTHLSIFAPALANFIRLTHASFAWTIFGAYLFSTALFLYACWQIAVRLLTSRRARLGALWMSAALYSLPVAGTALFIMDPYLTARSFSTPLDLLTVAAALDRRYVRSGIWVVLAALLHPLMAAFAFAFVVILILLDRERPRFALSLCVMGIMAAAIAYWNGLFQPIFVAYREALLLPAHTFLFLGRWQWYEVAGAVVPLLLFAVAAWKSGLHTRIGHVCLAAILTGISSLIIAIFFVPVRGPYLLVPLQVMRIDHILYALGVILLGALVAHFTHRRTWIAFVFFLAAFTGMGIAARLSYPGSRAIEWPGLQPENPWSQAFLWIRVHTPPDAVFAFNPRLVYQPEEDEQGFRVLTERSQLPDDKDAGVVAVFPSLAFRWARERNATLHINTESDTQRLKTLTPLGVTWILLPPQAATQLPCPYTNSVIKVCRLLKQR